MKNATIYIADDHKIVRQGLRYLLSAEEGLEIIGEASDGFEAWVEIDASPPDLVILDIGLPTMSGAEVAAKISRYHPGTRIVILSQNENDQVLSHLIRHGIDAYVLKDDAEYDLLDAIRAALAGHCTFSRRVRLREGVGDVGRPMLTSREREILKLAAEGYTNNQIGAILFISPKTAKIHRSNLSKKLGLKSIADLVRYAVRNGYVNA